MGEVRRGGGVGDGEAVVEEDIVFFVEELTVISTWDRAQAVMHSGCGDALLSST